VSLLFSYPLSESLISWIKGLHGLLKKLKIVYSSSMSKKSVKSLNLCQSVIQTIYDIVKAHGGELKVETKEGEGSEFIIQLPVEAS
jgi:signal transduction histidine kinase